MKSAMYVTIKKNAFFSIACVAITNYKMSKEPCRYTHARPYSRPQITIPDTALSPTERSPVLALLFSWNLPVLGLLCIFTGQCADTTPT